MTGSRPHPGLMPKKRAAVPAAPVRLPAVGTAYAVDPAIPRRGLADAAAWPDTSVLLSLHARGPADGPGSDYDLPAMFREHYRRRLRLAERIDKELRWLTRNSDVDVATAATNAVHRLHFEDRPVDVQQLDLADATEVEKVHAQLKAVPGASRGPKDHLGEAEVIVLARKAALRDQTQILLANDAGASVVAKAHGIASRHAADVIAELACADPALTSDGCLRRFRAGDEVSSVPHTCRPSGPEAFACARAGDGTCVTCD
ncbi:MAG: hypothetical protein ACYCU5_00070 [Actinomycetes bacterium]